MNPICTLRRWLPLLHRPAFVAGATAVASPVVALRPREVRNLGAVPGRRLECLAGNLWITQDGDPRDLILAPGEHVDIVSDAPTIVMALDEARARIH